MKNVRHFGAKGDESADDTGAINAAIRAAAAAGGDVVYFPPGTYLVSPEVEDGGGICFPLRSTNVKIQGAGRSSTTIKMTNFGDDFRCLMHHSFRRNNVLDSRQLEYNERCW